MKNSEPIAEYFYENLGIDLVPIAWEKADSLPIYLQDNYRFKKIQISGKACLLACDQYSEEQSPAVIRKHMEQVRAKFDGEIIYVRMKMSAHNRKRLIQQKVSFVVPGNQMYLPTLGVDLREHFKAIRSFPEQFSPATQLTLIYILLDDFDKTYRPKELAAKLGYTSMTMSRVFDELDNLAEINKQGRERLLLFHGKKIDLWKKILPRLSSPVQKRIQVPASKISPQALLAGLSALSHYSSLAEPANPVYAVGKDLTFTPTAKTFPDSIDQDTIEVEIWQYNPLLFAKDGFVDPISLYLSLQDNPDVRVEAALQEMMSRLAW